MDEIIIDKIIRSRRRTVALMISSDAALIVRAPMMTTLRYIQELVYKRKAWIRAKMEQILKYGCPARGKKFINGEEFLYLGKLRKLKVENFEALPVAERRALVVAWYHGKAREVITKRALEYGKKTGWNFSSLKITSANGRWGSCGPKGSINFAWKLMMAPLEVIDYVVVHELAHITEKNHSKRFWGKVRSVLPDYKERQRWLKAKENRLHFKI